MKENIRLRTFLRSLPEGAMLYCPLFGWEEEKFKAKVEKLNLQI